ncbi:MAG: hypothetical protein KC684_02510 [Candidatus Omnitrophica bacterium]|nr:hypothetical protein [Candidatus Omnitrophota bacterium]
MKKAALFILVLFLSYPVYAEIGSSLSVSSYYPSPFGAYETLRLVPRAQIAGTSCDIGTLYNNENDGDLLYYCIMDSEGDGEWINYSPGVWQDYHNDVYLTDMTNPKSQAVGIGTGTTTPIEFKLTLQNDAGIIAAGTFGSGYDLTTSGAGTRFIWHAKKGAIRAGTITGGASSTGGVTFDDTSWNDANIGNYSVGFGEDAFASGTASSVRGGLGNYITGDYSLISGGSWNTILSADYSSILGSTQNLIRGDHSMTAGGIYGVVDTDYSVSVGGYTSSILDDGVAPSGSNPNGGSVMSSGYFSILTGDYSLIGGYRQTLTGRYSSIGAGSFNILDGDYSVIVGGGGYEVLIGVYGDYISVLGGHFNFAGSETTSDGDFSVIGGGIYNNNYGTYSFIGGGSDNDIKNNISTDDGDYAAIGGGWSNKIRGDETFIGGGQGNTIDGNRSTVTGGYQNSITGTHGFIGGGNSNAVNGNYSTILGGANNSTACAYTHIGGRNMNTSGTCGNGFLWGHSASAVNIALNDQFIVYSGNMGIGTTSTSAKLDVNGNVRVDNGSVSISNIPTIAGTSSPVLIDAGGVIGYDLAEEFQASEIVSPGDVLIIDHTNPDQLKKSHTAYDHHAIGVVSLSPAGVLKSQRLELAPGTFTDINKDSVPVALTGRVLCNVSLENGNIQPGDLLTTSSTPGYAMKSTDKHKAFGAIIGKALESFSDENKTTKGQIVILINRQ